jgi:hypothetical protein
MSVLKSLESRIAGLVEGSFSRAFRSEVRPVEIARRLAREMDANRTPFVSRVYAPFSYEVYLGDEDSTRFEGHERELISELSTFLLEHARRERLVLAERPKISIHRDERLGLGEFGIKTTPVDKAGIDPGQSSEPQRQPRPEPPRAEPPAPPVAAPPVSPAPPTPPAAASPPLAAALVAAGHRIELDPSGLVFGRSRECDVVLQDPNASRRHARVYLGPTGWTLEDLGSTNGISVNGVKIPAAQILSSGDSIELGNTQMTFELG